MLLIPAAVYLWFVHSFAVNAIYYDQWDNVALLTRSPYGYLYTAHPTLLVRLWQQHNENRTFFPNLVVLALGSWTHLNVIVEEFLSATTRHSLSTPGRLTSPARPVNDAVGGIPARSCA